MKSVILLALVFLCCSAAVPISQKYRLKRNVISGSENGENLVESTTKEQSSASTAASRSSSVAHEPLRSLNKTTTPQDQEDESKEMVDISTSRSTYKPQILVPDSNFVPVETRSSRSEDTLLPLHADEFKVKVLEPTEPSRQTSLQNLIKTPDFYILKVPHFIIVKESDIFTNQDYGIPSFTDSFSPFQEIPNLTQDFPIDSSTFGLPGSYPIYPIEIPQNSDHYPIISIGDNAPEISDFEGITGAVEILNPEPIINIEQHDEQVVNHETDSISVEALESSKEKNSHKKMDHR